MTDRPLCLSVNMHDLDRDHHILCEKPEGHDGNHASGGYVWPQTTKERP